ncbi:hypothetical protein SRHO_G00008050 [Serrasalmus rhombeus]
MLFSIISQLGSCECFSSSQNNWAQSQKILDWLKLNCTAELSNVILFHSLPAQRQHQLSFSSAGVRCAFIKVQVCKKQS